jgi:peptide/nickel transport system permease protein
VAPWWAIVWLVAAVAASLAASILAPHNPAFVVGSPLEDPSPAHWFGTDNLGRDVGSRLLFGGRVSIAMAVAATLLSAGAGGALGLAAATAGGRLDRWIGRLANTLLAIPGLVLALLFVASIGPGIQTLALAVGLAGVPGFARLSRPAFLQPRRSDFADASRALGARLPWIAVRHILPNARLPLVSLATTFFGWSFLGITGLTFLGLAGDPSLAEWGAMLQSGRGYLFSAPWLALAPGAAISLTVLSVQRLGTWLSEIAEPVAALPIG